MTPQEFERAKEYARQLAKKTAAKIRSGSEEAAATQRRPVTDAEISTLEGFELVCRVSDRIDFLAEEGRLSTILSEQRAVVSLFHLDGQISNGGFHQYFWNTQAQGLEDLRQDASILQGSEAHAVVSEAITRAKEHPYRRSWLMKKSKWWWQKQFERGYAEKRFDDLDDRYDALSPPVMDLLSDFIRQHSTLFVENA